MQNNSFSWSVLFSLKLKCLMERKQTEAVFMINVYYGIYILQ